MGAKRSGQSIGSWRRMRYSVMVVFVFCFGSAGSDSSPSCPPCGCKIIKNGIMQMDCINTNLTKIPSPPKTRKHKYNLFVNFNGNHLPLLTKKLLVPLQFPHHVQFLSLRRNSIRTVSSDVFEELRSLYGLDISDNNITNTSFQNFFWSLRKRPSLRLNISSMRLPSLNHNFFQHLINISDLNITMRNNSLTEIPFEAIRFLTHLTYLDLGSNHFTDIKSIVTENCTSGLLELRMNNNYLRNIPNFCINSTASYFPRLKVLHLQYNKIERFHRKHYDCLQSLTHLYLDGNDFSVLKTNQFSGLPNLYLISLAYVGCVVKRIEGYAFNNTALRRISFRKNNLWFDEQNLTMFHGCSSLEFLNLQDNIFQFMTEKHFETLFKDLKSLKVLIIGRGGLYYTPSVITSRLTNLRTLAMFGNHIPSWEDGQLDNLTKLEKLLMRNNRITRITHRSFPAGFKARPEELDLTQNIFTCFCDILWFVRWMKSHEKKLYNESEYKCESPDFLKGTMLLNLTLYENKCLLSRNEQVITLSGGCILIVLLVVGAVMYRYRWHIRYFIYLVRYSQRQEVDTVDYEYDAFVAFSAPDRQWVISHLLPVLEEDDNLKLCVHDRDFQVGKLIVDNIVDSIQESRKIIIVLSNEFAQSGWCQFELNLIQRHVLEKGQRLLVVLMLEEIDTRHVTKAMRAMLQTTTYLMWEEEEYAKKAFFNRLRMLLRSSTRKAGNRRLSV